MPFVGHSLCSAITSMVQEFSSDSTNLVEVINDSVWITSSGDLVDFLHKFMQFRLGEVGRNELGKVLHLNDSIAHRDILCFHCKANIQ